MALKAHNDTGHLSFLLGKVKAGGWWYFYLVALAVKTPLPLLLSGMVGSYLLARDGLREANTWRMAPVVLFVTLLVFASAVQPDQHRDTSCVDPVPVPGPGGRLRARR